MNLLTSAPPRYDAGEARDAYPTILSATEPEVRTRIRIAHSKTQRDGWGFETTVEVEYTGSGDEDAGERIESLLDLAGSIGRQEADERNTIDRIRQGGDS